MEQSFKWEAKLGGMELKGKTKLSLPRYQQCLLKLLRIDVFVNGTYCGHHVVILNL